MYCECLVIKSPHTYKYCIRKQHNLGITLVAGKACEALLFRRQIQGYKNAVALSFLKNVNEMTFLPTLVQCQEI